MVDSVFFARCCKILLQIIHKKGYLISKEVRQSFWLYISANLIVPCNPMLILSV